MIEHPEAERVDPIAGDVRAVRCDSHERYGVRKIKAALERRGVIASGRRIVDIMKRRGMTSAYARRTFKPHRARVNEARLANIPDREFDGHEPRTRLASDLTYVRVGGKRAYVCLLIDLANRSIAGHSADTGRTADLAMAAFATLDFPPRPRWRCSTRTGAASSTTRRSTGCSTCSTSEDRCQGRATRTTTPWSNRRIGS